MIRRSFQDLSLPALGLGTMRLPTVGSDNAVIDVAATGEMIDYALKNGVNYFDTAWGYHAGTSEPTVGNLLSAYPRDSFFLTSKFPGFNLENISRVKEIFEEQLKRARTDHFDFYLFHSVGDRNADWYLDPQYGILDYLIEQKKNGRIRHLGCSVHASNETTKRFIEGCKGNLEFCQMQLNYFDWTYQDAKGKVDLLRSCDLPIWVMEPLRGGQLASLSPQYEERLRALRPNETVPQWGFRFLQSIPEVTVTLSGMSNMDQLKANIETFRERKPLNDTEKAALLKIAADMIRENHIPCTACRYCVERCPRGLDIPGLIEIYNDCNFITGKIAPSFDLMRVDKEKWPSACIACRSCEAVCPQQIPISEVMHTFSERLLP